MRHILQDIDMADYPVTAASIEAAKKAQAIDRQRVFERTGIRIVETPPFLILCPRPGCTFVGSARTDGGAVRSLSAHLVGSHLRGEK